MNEGSLDEQVDKPWKPVDIGNTICAFAWPGEVFTIFEADF